MDIEINYLAVALATLGSMVVGSVWYASPVFGTLWMKLAKVDKKKAEKAGWTPIVFAILTSVVTAYVLAGAVFIGNEHLGNSFLQDSLLTAFWLWLGISAARFVTHDAFESRPRRLTLLTVSHEFVVLMVMGSIIGLMGV